MWYAVWKVLQPQPLQSGMVCTLTSPRLLANSPHQLMHSISMRRRITCVNVYAVNGNCRLPADQARCLQISSVNEEGSSTAIASHERMEIEGELWCGGLYSKCFNSASFYLILHKWMIFLTIFLFLVHSSFIYSRWAHRSSKGYGSHGTATGRVQCQWRIKIRRGGTWNGWSSATSW